MREITVHERLVLDKATQALRSSDPHRVTDAARRLIAVARSARGGRRLGLARDLLTMGERMAEVVP